MFLQKWRISRLLEVKNFTINFHITDRMRGNTYFYDELFAKFYYLAELGVFTKMAGCRRPHWFSDADMKISQ